MSPAALAAAAILILRPVPCESIPGANSVSGAQDLTIAGDSASAWVVEGPGVRINGRPVAPGCYIVEPRPAPKAVKAKPPAA